MQPGNFACVRLRKCSRPLKLLTCESKNILPIFSTLGRDVHAALGNDTGPTDSEDVRLREKPSTFNIVRCQVYCFAKAL
jgi:hypothetical protein